MISDRQVLGHRVEDDDTGNPRAEDRPQRRHRLDGDERARSPGQVDRQSTAPGTDLEDLSPGSRQGREDTGMDRLSPAQRIPTAGKQMVDEGPEAGAENAPKVESAQAPAQAAPKAPEAPAAPAAPG